jgi:hypothetical protein
VTGRVTSAALLEITIGWSPIHPLTCGATVLTALSNVRHGKLRPQAEPFVERIERFFAARDSEADARYGHLEDAALDCNPHQLGRNTRRGQELRALRRRFLRSVLPAWGRCAGQSPVEKSHD